MCSGQFLGNKFRGPNGLWCEEWQRAQNLLPRPINKQQSVIHQITLGKAVSETLLKRDGRTRATANEKEEN